MSKVWELDLPQPLKLLALALADIGDDDGENIYASRAYLGWKVGAHPKTIQRQLKDLEERGIVEVVRRFGHRLPSGQWTRLLKMHPERGDILLPLPPHEGAHRTKRGSAGEQKGEHSYVHLSVSDPLVNRTEPVENPIPRLPGETPSNYLKRITSMTPSLDSH